MASPLMAHTSFHSCSSGLADRSAFCFRGCIKGFKSTYQIFDSSSNFRGPGAVAMSLEAQLPDSLPPVFLGANFVSERLLIGSPRPIAPTHSCRCRTGPCGHPLASSTRTRHRWMSVDSTPCILAE
eukprot:5935645-Amphidinium_carterae.2